MKTIVKAVTVICIATSIGACGSMTTRERDTVVGAGVGAAAGAAITGDTAGAVGGGVVGGVIGHEIHR
ncbi:MAG TPA: glycine zipper 2TM domain-containing protein [Casimicrobiaceae bacterium]|nr:glycine zipper 2TM domain-containing protein [Casimicrobiaceae bacterium]